VGSGGPGGWGEDLDAAAPAAVVLLSVQEDVVAAVDDRLGSGRFKPELVATKFVGEPSVVAEAGRVEPDRDDAGVEASHVCVAISLRPVAQSARHRKLGAVERFLVA
jgi:hypothetical protein